MCSREHWKAITQKSKQTSTLEGIHFDEEESEPCPVGACYIIMGLSLPYQGVGPFCEASRISDPQRLMGEDFCPEWSPSWEMIAPPFCDHEACIFSFLQAIIRHGQGGIYPLLFLLYIPYPVATQFGSNCLLREIFFTSFSKKDSAGRKYSACEKCLLC